MKYSQFVVWNFVVGAVYVLAVGPTAYGAGKVSSGEQDGGSLGALVAGLAIAAVAPCSRQGISAVARSAGCCQAPPGPVATKAGVKSFD